MSVLCSVLRKVSLSRLRSLLLRNCRLRQLEVGPLVDCLETGCLSRLETLDLERSLAWEIGGVNREESGEGIEGGGGEQISVLKMLIGILRVDALPCLKNLNLMSEYGWKSKREVEAFLAVLRSDECPPLEHLKLHLKDLGEDHVRALGGGEYPSIRTLCLSLSPHNVVVFLSAFVANVEGRQFEVLDFKLWPESSEKSQQEVAGEGLRLLSAAVEMARPACLRKLSVRGPVADSAQNVRGLFDAFTLVRPPTLTHLELTHCVCSDEVMFLLAKAVGKGHLPTLRVLVLSKLKPQGGQSTRVFGAVGMQALMEAVVRNPEGLLFLERLDVSETGGGVKPGALGKALVTAKLGRLWHINLSDSCLSDDGVKGLAAAAQKGGMYRVTELLLGGNPSVGQGRWSSLEAAVAKHAPHLRQFAKRERTQQTVYTELDDEKVPMKGKEGARECDRVSDGVSSTPEQVQLPVTVSEEGSDALSPKLGDVFQGSAETVAAEKAEEVTLHEENEEDFRVSYNDAIVAGFARLRGFGDRRAESSLSHQTSGDGIKPKRDQLGEGKSA
uniref:Uncharacterized protein n=1 Tax=Chromera velia CCMP2878 TaxID=1169474 RepID=A0A0G4GU63_9ALVE|eukprot:Cvel_757.t1-p1 / transcript=Cvel_757.t1 / gene=Cvel_757 / organism=Chromera_velia_CCMP2878 / gene_product=hypothetical protein / transcript_product=hypothetical protein / location=Cvel_scaffold23:132179-133846(-) / protein_length=556 / sequence_SO=supercontig / SO=protein_coding / is_pseudo=false